MTDNITEVTKIVIENPSGVSYADWAAIVIAVAAIIISIIFANKNLKLNRFITLIEVIWNELSTEEATRDRGLVKELNNTLVTQMDEIKRIVVYGREKQNKTEDSAYGVAIERSIARFDRVSFFLLGHRDRPFIEPPVWLWTLVSEIWEKLGAWVEYRQTCEQEDPSFYHKNYGIYLQRLEKYRKAHHSKETNHDTI